LKNENKKMMTMTRRRRIMMMVIVMMMMTRSFLDRNGLATASAVQQRAVGRLPEGGYGL
jgi:hypothetical protein